MQNAQFHAVDIPKPKFPVGKERDREGGFWWLQVVCSDSSQVDEKSGLG